MDCVRNRGSFRVFLTILFFLTWKEGVPSFQEGRAQETWRLEPLQVEGAPSDVIQEDPILPEPENLIPASSGTGSLSRGFAQKFALPIAEGGRPGERSQVRGWGAGVSDTSVQALGVPLNSPLGTGFDLSVFPSFLWSHYRFQAGPSLGVFDAQGVAGTVTLVPWSMSALSNPEMRPFEFHQFYSDAGLFQMAVGAHYKGQAAIRLGMSEGRLSGPSAVASVKREWGRAQIQGHFFVTSVEAEIDGTEAFPTPGAKQFSERLLPIVQMDLPLGEGVWKSSLFYDHSTVRFENPSEGMKSDDFAWQWGWENVWTDSRWRLGATVRRLGLKTSWDSSIPESQVSLQVARLIRLDQWSIDPVLQGFWVSDHQIRPMGSIGLRRAFGPEEALYSRVGYSIKIPSLADRYYSIPGSVRGNASLLPERVWSGTLGYEGRLGSGRQVLEARIQERRDFQAPGTAETLFQKTNEGAGRLVAVQHRWEGGWNSVRVQHALTLAHSEITRSGLQFPYFPRLLEGVGLEIGAPPEAPKGWAGGVQLRAVTRADSLEREGRIPGYALWDAELRTQFSLVQLGGENGPQIELRFRVENLTDRRIEATPGEFLPERLWLIQLTGVY